MKKGQKAVRGNIEDFLCPFTDMYISQGSNESYSHKGIMANDVRGLQPGVRYPYYAPCTCKCLKLYPKTGQVMWQSVNKVRFANGRIDYATFMTAHDESMNAKIGQVVIQGNQLGNMGRKGFSNITGVHCHIQISQSKDTTWKKNIYGNYRFNNEYDLDDCYFVDDTNIIKGNNGNWRATTDVKVEETVPQNTADQVLYKNSKVCLGGTQIQDIKTKGSLTTFYSKKYDCWLPITPFYRIDADGKRFVNQNSSQGNWINSDVVFTVKSVSKNPDRAVIEIDGSDYNVLSSGLYEVSNS